MKKTDFIKMLKPVIKECIKEVLLEETGVMSKLIAEIAVGLSETQQLLAEEKRTSIPESMSWLNEDQDQQAQSSPPSQQQQVVQRFKNMAFQKKQPRSWQTIKGTKSRAPDLKIPGFEGIFEGVKAMEPGPTANAGTKAGQSAMTIDPARNQALNDPGIDISGLFN